MKRFLGFSCLFCLLCLLSAPLAGLSAASAAGFPAELRFTQNEGQRVCIRDKVYSLVTYPVTSSDIVNAEMREVLGDLYSRGLQHIPSGSPGETPSMERRLCSIEN